MEFFKWVDSSLVFVFQVGWIEIVARAVGDPLGNFLRNLFENPTVYIPSTGTVKAVVFVLFGIWLFSFLIWDFILTMFKQYEFMRIGESNVFDLKREVQTFLLGIVFIGWGLYYLYGWFDEPGMGTWLVGGAVLLLSGWANRSLSTRWMVADWEPLERENGEKLEGEDN